MLLIQSMTLKGQVGYLLYDTETDRWTERIGGPEPVGDTYIFGTRDIWKSFPATRLYDLLSGHDAPLIGSLSGSDYQDYLRPRLSKGYPSVKPLDRARVYVDISSRGQGPKGPFTWAMVTVHRDTYLTESVGLVPRDIRSAREAELWAAAHAATVYGKIHPIIHTDLPRGNNQVKSDHSDPIVARCDALARRASELGGQMPPYLLFEGYSEHHPHIRNRTNA